MDFRLDYVDEFVDTSQRCTKPMELRDALMDHVSILGFEHLAAISLHDGMSVIRVPGKEDDEPQRIGTYSDDWNYRFFEGGYKTVDPVSARMKSATTPYFWNETFQIAETATVRPRLYDQFIAESRELGLVEGLTVPVIDKGQRSAISFCGSHAEGGSGVLHMMHVISIYFQQRLLGLCGEFETGDTHIKVSLTPREKEVLCWYARGKSAWDISVMLGVSESAIRFHMANIRSKYGVSSSVHATVLAVSQQDIHL